jgi:hypothetical protein
LDDYEDADVLVVVFMANHCPVSQQYEHEFNSIVDDYQDKNVALVAISSSSPLGVMDWQLRRSDLNDDFESMIIRARDKHFRFPYLYDGDTQEVCLKYGPVATPHCFVFDRERKLRYTGRAGEQLHEDKQIAGYPHDLRGAIDSVLTGKEIQDPVTPRFGCSTKWSWKAGILDPRFTGWMDNPVGLEEIDAEGVARLLANDSHKILMVNVYSVLSETCVEDYPKLIKTYAMYHPREYVDPDRGFEFASISIDDIQDKVGVLEFLEESESKTLNNFIYSGDDIEDFVVTIDPEWDGAVPYTLLVAPRGEVYYRHRGSLDIHELRKAIVDHPTMGRI